jgi:hypothetical protein
VASPLFAHIFRPHNGPLNVELDKKPFLISENEMSDEIELVFSPMCGEVEREGHVFELHIYEDEERRWILEVVNASGTSIIWDERFLTDLEAVAAFELAIEEDGAESMLG